MSTQLDEYISKLKSHDWFYEFSDDHSVWQRGKAERHDINVLQKELDPDNEVWNQHCPEYFLFRKEWKNNS